MRIISRSLTIIGLVLVLCPCVCAQLGTASIQVSPANPTTNDTISIRLSGTWPTGCTPQSPQVSVSGGQIRIATVNPAANCTQALTPWSLTVFIGRLPAGTYQVSVTHNQQPIGSAGFSVANASPSPLGVELAVDRGCGASYRIGELVLISFRTSRDAAVTLRVLLPDGSERVLVSQAVPGGVTSFLQALVGDPAGTRVLLLEATSGSLRASADCSFTGFRDGGSGPLRAEITTNRGSLERGQNPLFLVGEPIVIQFRVEGAPQAMVTIEDILADGRVQILLRQTVPGGQTLSLTAVIAPPTGRERLRLTAQSGSSTAVAEASFIVAAARTVPLPDLTLRPFDWEIGAMWDPATNRTIPAVIVRVRNEGAAAAPPSVTQIDIPNARFNVNTPAIPAGGTVLLAVPFPSGVRCGAFLFEVDVTAQIVERDEANNRTGLFIDCF